MTGEQNTRWADTEEDAAAEAQRKREKEEKKRVRAEKQQRLQEDQERAEQLRRQESVQPEQDYESQDTSRPVKKRRLSPSSEARVPADDVSLKPPLLRFPAPQWYPCRQYSNYERLNHIEEGSYGYVSRAREIATGDIVAIKQLKQEHADSQGFPVTGLREIECLMEARGHKHIVELREVVMGGAYDHERNETYLVMEFLEHDLKTLQEEMHEPFLPSEVKTLMQQLAGAVAFLHSHWILHRDLKTSNILMSNRGQIKLADFGMARFYSNPPPTQLTQLVVTLWYRAPELLLGAKTYTEAIDLWSCGCIFAELLTRKPLFQGKAEVDQLTKIFKLCGVPNEQIWPGFRRLPNARALRLPPREPNQKSLESTIRAMFPQLFAVGANLLASLLAYNPPDRPSARDILAHDYFKTQPLPKHPLMFPTFPSKAGLEKRRLTTSPSAPKRGDAPRNAPSDFVNIFGPRDDAEAGGGFQLKLS